MSLAYSTRLSLRQSDVKYSGPDCLPNLQPPLLHAEVHSTTPHLSTPLHN